MPVVVSHNAEFQTCERGSGTLVLEDAGTLRLGRKALNIILLYPDVPAALSANPGIITDSGVTESIHRQEFISISGQAAPLGVPRRWIDSSCAASGFGSAYTGFSGVGSDGGVEIERIYARDPYNGNEINPSIAYDSGTNEIRASRPVYGLYRVRYQARAHRYTCARAGSAAQGSAQVVAFYRGAFAEVSLSGISGGDYTTVYYVTSDYVADIEGQWEVPPGWPDDNTYPDKPGQDPLPDNEAYQQLQRKHEVGVINPTGNFEVQTYSAPNATPYVGDGGYRPKYTYRQSSTPQVDSPFFEVWANLDFADIIASVTQRYPGVIVS